MKLTGLLKSLVIFAFIAMNIGCDQASKNMVRNKIDAHEKIAVIGKHLTLTKVENNGAALGFGASFHPTVKFITIIVLPSVILLAIFVILMLKNNIDKRLILGLAFITGGGIGNLIDRIVHGSVTDFLIIDLGFFRTGIFNMADMSVTIGVLIIFIYGFRKDKEITPLA
ncbi:signal peptidase II [Leptobacterium flavescens]|uniref:Lipoprotein signal peptidase n=1 Tax=Leptobacterium flavescens TaxID=472055 RepID=A0A6P0UHN5_9FLAO|nr:signal peptidase II [Leptobacterium flavescens]NER11960.1 signal peptidase II [Leptobacterium flavescens]